MCFTSFERVAAPTTPARGAARISEALTGEELDFSSVTERIARLLAEVLDADCSLALLSGDGSVASGSARH